MSLTNYYPTAETHKNIITTLSQSINLAMDNESLIERHNAFVDYTLALVFSATGHRAVKDPISSIRQIDLQNGLVLISDKVTHENRAWRLVALPAIACEQIQNYLDYLPKLAENLENEVAGTLLPTKIRQLFSHSEAIPLFFYLSDTRLGDIENITPKLMAQRWSKCWSLPINFLRHTAATELLKLESADYAQIQLGHASGNAHQFGENAAESAKDTLAKIGLALNKYLREMGWKPIKSPVRLPYGFSEEKIILSQLEPLSTKEFGHNARRKNRLKSAKQKRVKLKSYIINAKNSVLNDQSDISTVEEVRGLVNYLVQNTPEDHLNQALRLLYRHVSHFPKGKEIVKRIAPIRVLRVEKSPFDENTIYAYQQAIKIRKNFTDYLDSCQAQPTKLQRTSEILISTALFAGISDTRKLEGLLQALKEGVHQLTGGLYVDIPLTDKENPPVYRWRPDEVCQALIQGLYKWDLQGTYSTQQIRKTLSALMGSIGFEDVKNPFDTLSEAAKAIADIEAPGHLRKVLSGELNVISLPYMSWVRMHSGKALDINSTPLIADFHSNISNELNVIPDNKHSFKRDKKFIVELRQVFKEAKAIPLGGKENLSTKFKSNLPKLIKEKFDGASEFHSKMLSVAAWSIYLCKQGTRAKKRLAISTIEKYTFFIANSLAQIELNKSFDCLDSDEYESLYLHIIEMAPESRRHELAGRLREFHWFMESAYAVEPLSWSEILKIANINIEDHFADANMVSEDEYLAIINGINNTADLDRHTRIQYISLVMLGYRFGLRFGEALRLQRLDVLIEGSQIELNIRNSMFGETKTDSGIRVSVLLEELTELESHSFNDLLQYTDHKLRFDKQIGLFTSVNNSRELISRNKTSLQIGFFIKYITGDSSLRFHHLRHSWASRMYAYFAQSQAGIFNSVASESIISSNWESFTGSHQTSYVLESISNALGHASITTTLVHYNHVTSLSLYQYYDTKIKPMSMKAYAYALGISYDNAKQRSARGVLLKINKSIPKPKVKLKPRPIKMKILSDTDSKVILTSLEIEVFLSRLRATQQKAKLIAEQLLIDPKVANEIVDRAIQVERTSGVGYYQLIRHDQSQLFLGEEEKQAKLAALNNKAFILQDNNIQTVLRDYDVLLNELPESEISSLSSAFLIWQRTLKGDVNIVSDSLELEAVKLIHKVFFSDLKLTLNGEIKLVSTEKVPLRKQSKKAIKFGLNKRINTQIMLQRIMFILSIAVSLNLTQGQ
jgi:integrase